VWWEKLSGSHSWQRPISQRIIDEHALALFIDQGCGKSYITCGAIEKLLHYTWSGLVLSRLSNIDTTWDRMLRQIPGLGVHRTWEEFDQSKGPALLLTNHEQLPKLSRHLTRFDWDLACCDESHRIKDRGGKQSRVASRISAEKKLILSGTPMDAFAKQVKQLKRGGVRVHPPEIDPAELWAQWRFLDPVLFGTRWEDFKWRYCREAGYKGYKVLFTKPGQRRFWRKASPQVVYVTQEEVLDLSPPIYHWVKVPLKGKQRRAYETMERDKVLHVGDTTVMAPRKVTELVKCQQLTSGYILDEKKKPHQVGDAKLRMLKRLLPDLDTPVVIYCRELEEIDQVEQLLSGTRVATIQGKNRRTRPAVVDAFQNGDLDYLVVQQRAGGEGVDLYRSHVAVFYSVTWSWITFDQCVKRLQRDGQTEQVEIYLLFCDNTVDRDMISTVLSKRNVTVQELKKLKQRRPNG